MRPLKEIFNAIDGEYAVLKDQLQAWERARGDNDLSYDTQGIHAAAAEMKRHVDDLVSVVPKAGAKNPLRPTDELSSAEGVEPVPPVVPAQTAQTSATAKPETPKSPGHLPPKK